MAFPDTDLTVTINAYLGADPTADPGTWPTPTDLSSRLLSAPVTVTRGRRPGQSTLSSGSCSFWLDNTDGYLTPLLAASPYYPHWDLGVPVAVDVDDVGASPPYPQMRGYVAAVEADMVPGPDGHNISAVRVTLGGLVRRLSQGSEPLGSPLRRWYDRATPRPIAYWPMEDDSSATQVQSGIAGGRALALNGPSSAGDTAVPAGSASGVRAAGGFASATAGAGRGGYMQAPIVYDGSELVVDFWLTVDISGAADADGDVLDIRPFALNQFDIPVGQILMIIGTGTDQFFISMFSTGGSDLATFTDADAVTTAVDGRPHHFRIVLAEDGADVDVELLMDSSTIGTTTFTATTIPAFTGDVALIIPEMARRLDATTPVEDIPIVLTHFAIWDDTAAPSPYEAGLGYAGEMAHDRIERLCDEEGVPFSSSATVSAACGPQPFGVDFLTAIRDAETVDHGMLTELTSTWGLGYRSLMQRYNLSAGLTIDLSTYRTTQGTSADVLRPVRNDQRIRNEWTIRRPNGGEATAKDEAHQAKRGRYNDGATVNVYLDDDLQPEAEWRVHEGRFDGLRYATIPIDLGANPSTLLPDWLELELGDRIDRTNHLAQHPGDDVTLTLEGYSQRIRPRSWEVGVVADPFATFDVGEYQTTNASGDVPRYDTEWSSTVGGLWLPNTTGTFASTPSDASLQLTGDLDLRCRIRLLDYANGSNQHLVGKWTTVSDQRSYRLRLSGTGTLVLEWSTAGTLATVVSETMSPNLTTLVNDGDIISVRAELDADNGSGGYTVTFYTSSDDDLTSATWTQQDQNVVSGGATSVFSGSAAATVGANPSGTESAAGVITAAAIRGPTGGGSIRANPRFIDQADGTTSFVDSAGKTWTVNGTAAIAGPFVAGTSTLLVVHTSVPPYWTTDPPNGWPILIRVSGAVLSVTGIANSTPPQGFTVSTTVPNGVTKTIALGESVRVARPAYYGL